MPVNYAIYKKRGLVRDIIIENSVLLKDLEEEINLKKKCVVVLVVVFFEYASRGGRREGRRSRGRTGGRMYW